MSEHTEVLLAAPDVAQEAALVAVAPALGVRIVRRCVDAVDLQAAAAVDERVAAVVSARLPRLSADVVRRLGPARPIAGLAADPLDVATLEGCGVRDIVAVEPDAGRTWDGIVAALHGATRSSPESPEARRPDAHADDLGGRSSVRGRLIAVWGPVGSPGRTTVALGVASAAAASGLRTCVVDADTYGPSLGLLCDVPAGGLLRLCRQAEHGLLDVGGIGATAYAFGSAAVVSGIPRPELWTQLRPAALEHVWECARAEFEVVIVDVGFCIENAAEAVAWARERNVAALCALRAADDVLAVADSSDAGAARLALAWPDLLKATASAPVVVRNRAARRRDVSWEHAISELGVTAHVFPVASSRRRRSAMRRSLGALAARVVSG